MAEIAPFRGLLYDTSKVPADKVLAPPYDVIGEDDRARLEAEHDKNVVRLILPRGSDDRKYAQAADSLHAWLADGTLVRDARPAIYRYAQSFTAEGQSATRRGFIALVKLARFAEGVVKPHERTLAGPKADRLRLKRATRTHLSQVFALYSDPAGEADAALAPVDGTPPLIHGTTLDGVEQSLWRVEDAGVIARVARALAPRPVYIADGHHRYETMLAIRDELLAAHPDAPPRSAARYGTLFLANMDDPSLLVFPTHRLVHGLPRFALGEFLERAGRWFHIERVGGEATDAARVRAGLKRRGAAPVIAMLVPGDADVSYLTLKPEGAREIPGPDVLRTLDVTVLHALAIEKLLGIDRAAQEAQSHLVYIKDTAQALEQIAARQHGCQVGFLMNPTRVEQVRAVADAGEVMPQKSTFFYPKLASGVVMNQIDPAEVVVDPLAR